MLTDAKLQAISRNTDTVSARYADKDGLCLCPLKELGCMNGIPHVLAAVRLFQVDRRVQAVGLHGIFVVGGNIDQDHVGIDLF